MVEANDIREKKIYGPLQCVKEEEESDLICYSSNIKKINRDIPVE